MNVESAKGFVYYGNFVGAYDKWLHANKRWKAHWFETCVEIYQKSRKWARDFVIDLKNKVISKIPHSKVIVWNCEKINYPKGTELFYLIRAVTKENELIFSKVGTTTRAIDLRMLEHLKYYKNIGVYRIYVDKVYNCGDLPAECYESYFRAKYIRKYPNTFKKNDRFMGVEFDLNEADKIFQDCQKI